MKKPVAIIMALLLIFTLSFPCFATETGDNEEATTEHPETTEYPNDPGRAPDLVATAAIVIDASTGQVLYEKNSHEKRYPASITKIMTTLLALEHNVDFNETISMSENAIWGIERDSTNIGLDVGEKVTIKDLIYATMVKSANECAYMLAEIVGGDVESFSKMMNDKAESLGCENTHFITPNGLHDDNHYTCAYDMALITKAALENETFREIAGTVSYTVPPTNLADEERFFWNGNKMINPNEPYYYEYCEGGKTGYTMVAHNTLVTFSKKDGLELICVILDCDGGAKYAYSDTRALYNYCYNNYTYYYPLSDFSFESEESMENQNNIILNNYYSNLNHDLVDLAVDKEYSILVNRSLDTTQIEQTVSLFDEAKDTVLGEITFTYEGEVIGSTPITTSAPLLSSTMNKKDETEKEKASTKYIIKKILFILLIVVLSLLGLFLIFIIVLVIIRNVQYYNRRRRYKRRWKRKDDDYYF